MSKQNGIPLMILNDFSGVDLQRIAFCEKAFDEAWMQNLLDKFPSILPVNDLGTEFAPLISVGREMATESGFIDNIFVSPEGHLTIVETKLWRNPQAVREVVAQVLDYAKDLTQWSFEDLNTAVKIINKGKTLIDLVSDGRDWTSEDETIFVDGINRNLSKGRFLLLVVGDGIRENVERMLDYLNQFPQIQFTFAMVELQTYEANLPGMNKVKLVIPQLRIRTKEVIRGIVKVEIIDNQKPKVTVNIEDTQPTELKQRRTLGREEFYESLRTQLSETDVNSLDGVLESLSQMGLKILERQASITVRLLGRDNREFFSLIEWNKSGVVAISAYFPGKIVELKLPQELIQKFYHNMNPVFGTHVPQGNKQDGIPIKDVLLKKDLFLQGIEQTIKELNEALAMKEETI